MAIEFKDPTRHRPEWDMLGSKNHHAQDMIKAIAQYIFKQFKKDLVITMIYRRQDEQDAIYKGLTNSKGIKYDDHPWKSDHQFWNCVDIRSSIYSEAEITEIEAWINKTYNPFNKLLWTAKCHTVPGQARHFHIQFIKKV